MAAIYSGTRVRQCVLLLWLVSVFSVVPESKCVAPCVQSVDVYVTETPCVRSVEVGLIVR